MAYSPKAYCNRGCGRCWVGLLYLEIDAGESEWQKPTTPLGVPVWNYEGIICTGESDKDKVKFTFARGAALDDPEGRFAHQRNTSSRSSPPPDTAAL